MQVTIVVMVSTDKTTGTSGVFKSWVIGWRSLSFFPLPLSSMDSKLSVSSPCQAPHNLSDVLHISPRYPSLQLSLWYTCGRYMVCRCLFSYMRANLLTLDSYHYDNNQNNVLILKLLSDRFDMTVHGLSPPFPACSPLLQDRRRTRTRMHI